ncbi:hypothetical protein [Shewanella woodyi]|uniref:hypothetical protein n=1 Tax=Shewanella woodyi TaxID=60961 RepID=UPI0007E9E8E6|nr:hypothetical protein [Shewanella woodyi]
MNLNNPPVAFTITRLDTPLGTIRVEGEWSWSNTVSATQTDAILSVSSLDIMGTDGWVALDLKLPNTSTILEKLNVQIVEHLQKR